MAATPWPLHEAGLSADLRGNLIVRQTGSGKERDLLATSDGVHHICAKLQHTLLPIALTTCGAQPGDDATRRSASCLLNPHKPAAPIVEMPVWIISSGYVRSDGLIDDPAQQSGRGVRGPTSPPIRARAAAPDAGRHSSLCHTAAWAFKEARMRFSRGMCSGLAVDVEVRLCQDGRAAVDGLSGAIEDTAEHILRHRGLEHLQRVDEPGSSFSGTKDLLSEGPVRDSSRVLRTSPVNSRVVAVLSMPEVPSKTCDRNVRHSITGWHCVFTLHDRDSCTPAAYTIK